MSKRARGIEATGFIPYLKLCKRFAALSEWPASKVVEQIATDESDYRAMVRDLPKQIEFLQTMLRG